MESIVLNFTMHHRYFLLSSTNKQVALTLDENGKRYAIEIADCFGRPMTDLPGQEASELVLPKRILKAFTESAINEILSKDEIPNVSSMTVLDGDSYEIAITKGNERKEYYADELSIETYPLLRYLASWCRKRRF